MANKYEHVCSYCLWSYFNTCEVACGENKETLAPLAPLPVTHTASTPSSQLSQLQKLYKYTHTLFHIHTHPHTQLFLLTPFFLLTTALSIWCSRAHSRLQLACKACVFMCVSFVVMVPAECRHKSAHLWFWREKMQFKPVCPLPNWKFPPRRTRSVVHLREMRGKIQLFPREVQFFSTLLQVYLAAPHDVEQPNLSVHKIPRLLSLHVLLHVKESVQHQMLPFWQQHHMHSHKSDQQCNRIQWHCCLEEAARISKNLWSSLG